MLCIWFACFFGGSEGASLMIRAMTEECRSDGNQLVALQVLFEAQGSKTMAPRQVGQGCFWGPSVSDN